MSTSDVEQPGERSLYSEFRPDGWPLCPRCGEDKLWSAGDGTDQSTKPSIESIVGCYRCGWDSVRDTKPNEVP